MYMYYLKQCNKQAPAIRVIASSLSQAIEKAGLTSITNIVSIRKEIPSLLKEQAE